jgi:hypothetical protein
LPSAQSSNVASPAKRRPPNTLKDQSKWLVWEIAPEVDNLALRGLGKGLLVPLPEDQDIHAWNPSTYGESVSPASITSGEWSYGVLSTRSVRVDQITSFQFSEAIQV